MTVTFVVFGTPEPKGSTKAFVRKMGDVHRAIVTSDNPSLKRWETLVRFEAQTALRRAGLDGSPFFDGAVAVGIRFGLIRPPSVTAKRRPWPTVKPDLDKLVRAAIDPLIGVLFRDDAQVVRLIDPQKFYVDAGRPAFCHITVTSVDGPSLPLGETHVR
jgi:Holliday junction resolvase RusA-like endonuclease